MSKRYPPAKWPLPAVVDPVERLCVRVSVPNDPAHIAAFRGALLALQSAYNWADDIDHTAREVALVWREIIRDMGTDWGCGLDSIEFRQIDDCELEYRIDGGTWTQAADFYSCAMRAINDAIAAGIIAAPGQQPAGGIITPGECNTYSVTMRANTRWHAPNPVSSGYTISVSRVSGAWAHSNELISVWACPDGSEFALGECGSPLATEPTDPLQTQPHMRLIGYTDGVYMDMYNTVYTVPIDTPPSDFYLQANDGSLADNQGEITLEVTICDATWCYLFDFTASDGSWVEPTGFQSIWSSNGWAGDDPTNMDRVFIKRTFDSAFITSIEVGISQAISDPYGVYICPGVENISCSGLSHTTGQTVFTVTVNDTITAMALGLERGGEDTSAWGYIRYVKIRGAGSCPFGTPNC